ncbi:MAG: VCBS repeat-containing protein [Deltaproteobacteria bacterium]|nr:VCBS repeat-containing protein [Deltaproteobacteria bacterium]
MIGRDRQTGAGPNARSVGAGLIALCLVLLWGAPVFAQTPHGDGSQTGDGSNAFTGLAQAPEANLFVGAATTSIAIEVSPGRKNLTPRLALAYSSSNGPSPYGYGWDLPLGRIQRSTKHGVLSCTDDSYRNDFVLALPGTSVECTLAGATCVPRIEESFLRIEYDAATTSWTVRDKSGLRYTFGDTAATRLGSSLTSLFSPGAPCSYIHAWALTRIQDTNGNTVDFSYINTDGMLYPDRILYGANPAAGMPAHPFEVNFVWSDEDNFGRPLEDQLLNGMGGFAARLTKILSRIEMRYPAGGRRVRWYSLQYYGSQLGASDPLGRQSFLRAVTLYDDYDQTLARFDGLPAASVFQYHHSDAASGRAGFAATAQSATRPALNQSPETLRWTDADSGDTWRDVFDINGDGFADLIDTMALHQRNCSVAVPDYWDVYLGSPGGFSTTPIAWWVPARTTMCDIGTTGDIQTYTTTVDLTGDGLPDFVDARGLPWVVYKGTAHSPYSPTNGWGFEAGVSWSAPRIYTRETMLGAALNGWDGSANRQDLLDMNGDGLPDLVRTAAPANDFTWKVWFNRGCTATGCGFGPEELIAGSSNAISFQTDGSNMVLGTFDINGDGLPDTVYSQRTPGGGFAGYWEVWLNRGHAIDQYAQWSLPVAASYIRHRNNNEPQDYIGDFFDLNGDGLPDVIDSSNWSPTNGKWQVYLNRGNGFAPQPLDWNAPAELLRDRSEGGGRTYQDTFDVDGDGLADYLDYRSAPYLIYHAADGAWLASGSTVVANEDGAKPDLLERMENGLDAATLLQYRPSTAWDNTGGDFITDLPFALWTLTGIERQDGMCDAQGACTGPAGSSHSLVTTISYQDGKFDTVERSFRGFGLVWSEDADDSVAPRRGVATYFHQSAALAGRVQESWTFDAANGGSPWTTPLARSENTWECADPITGSVIGCPAEPAGDVWVRLSLIRRQEFSNYSIGSARTSTTQNHSWHQCNGKHYGNVAHSSSGGTGTELRAHTHTDYACLDTASAYIADKPLRVWVNASDDSTALEEKWFVYDGGALVKGNVTSVFSWLDRTSDPSLPAGSTCPQAPHGGSGGCASVQSAYDAFGNLTTVTDALGRSTTTVYDSATRSYPYRVIQPTVDKPAPEPDVTFEAAMQYDPGCGKLLSQTVSYPSGQDPALQPKTRRSYDSFCRLEATYPVDEATTGSAQEFTYYLGNLQTPSATVVASREPNNSSGYLYRSTVSDALGRPLQQKHEAVIEGGSLATVATTTTYGERGAVAASFAPFTPGGLLYQYTSVPPGTGETGHVSDALGRVTQTTNPDGSVRVAEYNVAWQITTKDECYQAGSCAGAKVVEKRDAFGHVIEKQLYARAGGQDTLSTRTQYGYDELGRLRTTMQGDAACWNSASTIVLDYDAFGRKLSLDDPDSGYWRYGYNLAGNLIYQDDPKSGQHVQFCYDAINRITAKHIFDNSSVDDYVSGICGSAARIAYSYDAATVPYGFGRMTTVDDESGSTRVLAYDVRGRQLSAEKQIDFNSHLTTAVTETAYDAADHVTEITYPDGEVVAYDYDDAGQTVAATCVANCTVGLPAAYLQSLTYDLFGRPRMVTHGNATTDTRTYGDQSTNYRLATLATQQGTTSHLNLSYPQYTAGGLLAQIGDQRDPSGALSNSAIFGYDGVGRLTAVSGNPYLNASYSYDYLGNITQKEGRTFYYNDLSRPHRVTAMLNGAAFTAFEHDDNGNRSSKENQAQVYSYDADDRLSAITTGAQFKYDYTGQKTAQVSAGSETRYYGSLAEVAGGYLTKHYFAGGLRIASQRVVASGWQMSRAASR